MVGESFEINFCYGHTMLVENRKKTMRRDMATASDTSERQTTEVDEQFHQRLQTFDHRWSGAKDKELMARAGFIYTGVDDKVECTSCGLKLLNWTPTDDPLHEHATRRPLCSFINSRYRQLGQNKPPKHPQYQQLQARLDSFVGWPGRYVPKTPDELAAAGFFYIGSADRVTCFQCGITLRDWEEEHDPVTEHQRYSENCQFINNTDLDQLGVKTRTGGERDTDQTKDNYQGACGGNGSTVDTVKTLSGLTTENDVSRPESMTTHKQPCEKQTSKAQIQTEVPALQESKAATRFALTEKPVEVAKNPKLRVTATKKKLAEENKRLKAKRTCKVCQKETVSILFLPCGHLVTCSNCAPDVSDCITCGKAILGTVRTYFV